MYLLLLSFIVQSVIGWNVLDEPLSVVRGEKDVMLQQMGCVDDSEPDNDLVERLVSCTCLSEKQTVMSKDGEEFGCYTPVDVGCKLSLNGSDQVYPIGNPGQPTSEIKVAITPKLAHFATIKHIHIWNLRDLVKARGYWTEVTTEGMKVFGVANSKLNIAKHNSVWKGHVVKVSFGEDTDDCVVAKFEDMAAHSYPFDVSAWRKQL